MVQHQLKLSDEVNEFVRHQLDTGLFTTPDEVVSKTLEDAQISAAQKKLAALIQEGLDSGEGEEFTEERFDSLMDTAREELERLA